MWSHMNQIHTGCLVKCIRPNTSSRVPRTTPGEVYIVAEFLPGSYLKLRGPNLTIHNSNYKFDINRFELYEEDTVAYPTLKKQYFNT